MVEPNLHNELSEDEKKVLSKISPRRILLPVVLGILVLGYLFWLQFDPKAIEDVKWTSHALIWVCIAIALLILRHLAYAARLKMLSDGVFSWSKSIELIFIWEFSSAVSPTSLGGSIVAFFMLAQEKLSAAKTATIVLYTIIVDTIFFMISMPLLYMIYGALVIRPGLSSFWDAGGWGWTVVMLTVAMGLYGGFFFYGIFVDPKRLKQLLMAITRIKWFRRWRHSADELGDELILASRDVKSQPPRYHLLTFLYSASAWIFRFLILNALIIAFIPTTSLAIWDQILLYGRSEYMFMIMAFSPTPGSAGLAEIVFGGFLSDFVPIGLALMLAFFWRVLTYYVYLFAGVVVIPNWIRKVLNRRRAQRIQRESE